MLPTAAAWSSKQWLTTSGGSHPGLIAIETAYCARTSRKRQPEAAVDTSASSPEERRGFKSPKPAPSNNPTTATPATAASHGSHSRLASRKSHARAVIRRVLRALVQVQNHRLLN